MKPFLGPVASRVLLFAVAAVCAVLALSSASAQSTSIFGHNLVVNGNAEAAPGAPDTSSTARPLPGWTPTSNFTAVQYDAGDGVHKTDPGPADRAKNFFAGGPDNESSSARQTIDVSAEAAAIDPGGVKYKLSGYLGGYSDQADHVVVTATFLGDGGEKLGSAAIGPVTPQQRKDKTALLLRGASGKLPSKTRSIDVSIVATRFSGLYNDGYCDDIALVLTK